MQFLSEYSLFLLKAITVVIAISLVVGVILSKNSDKKLDVGHVTIENLSELFKEQHKYLQSEILTKEELKKLRKQNKSDSRHSSSLINRWFVLDFDGDIKASAIESLRHEVTAVLSIVDLNDQVIIRLNSPGGMVHKYGLAASQIKRLSDAGVKVTVAVDECAASGGYLMASVADRILAAPFAVIGSIGVIAQLPNFNKLLRKNDIEFEQHTAGDFKRTLTMFGENTQESRQKFIEELEQTHKLFKIFVANNRRKLDIERVSTGEHWYGTEALELNLIDELVTSDDFILNKIQQPDCCVYQVKHLSRKPIFEKVTDQLTLVAQSSFEKIAQFVYQSKLFK